MKSCLRALFGLLILSCLAHSVAFAQGGSAKSSLSGTVVDKDGGVIPGVTVVVKNAATGVATTILTNSSGVFILPSIDPATYNVTVSLNGFKTVTITNVRATAGQPANLQKVLLEIGSLTETVTVRGTTELIQSTTPTISSTINMDLINNLPAQTRNALYAVTLLPGVDTTATQTARNSTISGLPQYTINITLDGVNVSNNMQRQSDGFYSMVRAQLDAIEEVTVTTATQGADSAGQGAVQIRFVTRSGTNQYKGTFYHYHRDPQLNTNYYFNTVAGLAKNRVILNQFGGSEGGPIVIPGLLDGRGKAFFFFNYEQFRQPTEATRTRTIFNPQTQAGLFQYTTTGGTATVDVLALAANNGQISTPDPTIVALLQQIRTAAQSKGVITQNANPNTMQYQFQSPGFGIEHLPTTRVDVNINTRHRLSGTYYWQQVNRLPDIQNSYDANFPNFALAANYLSYRTSGSASLRSVLSSNLINTLQTGWQWSPGIFGAGETKNMYDSQAGFELQLGLVTSPTPGSLNNPENPRNTPNWNIDDTINWQRGNHSFQFGGSFTQVRQVDSNSETVPTISFGVDTTNDPANGMFTTANFTGASNTNLTDARNLYALLTGRITSIGATARLDDKTNQYVYLGTGTHHLKLDEYAAFAQDSWQWRSNITLNGGVRWELQRPVVPLNSNYATATLADLCGISGLGPGPNGRACNIFNPNAQSGIHPSYQQYLAGSPGYKTDYNNFAPNVGVAWRPNVTGGFLRHVFGDPEQATVRAGFSVAYNRNGMDEFQNIFGANPGRTFSGTRNVNNGNLVLPGELWPILLSQPSRLGPPAQCPPGTVATGCIPVTASFPIGASTGQSLNIFDPNIQLSYARSYSIGFQRAISKDMAVEVRYVGTRSINGWVTENWNETNLVENGFLDEFKRAQANLQAHVAAGCGTTGNPACSFAYRGPGTNTQALPIYLGYLTGQSAANANTAANYTGTNWTNTTLTGRFGIYQPSVGGSAGDLNGSATFRTNALTAGLPLNFFQMNPEVGNANVRTNGPFTKYDSLQLEVRKRLSHGLAVSSNYTFATRLTSQLDTLRRPRAYLADTSSVPHAFKVQANYELPVGRGRRFGMNMNPWVDAALGNWIVNFSGRVQSGRILTLSGVTLVGMDEAELQANFKLRKDAAGTIFMLPQEIIDNTVKAFSTSATSPNGYSLALGAPSGRYIAPASSATCIDLYPTDCGEPRTIKVTGPVFSRFDMSVKKKIVVGKRVDFDLEIDGLNIFNAVNFTPVFTTSTNPDNHRVTAAYQDISQTNDPGGRLGQIVWRINWR